MPIGIVSDDDLQREIGRLSGTSRQGGKITVIDKPGRKEGDVNVPDGLRQIIGETAVIDGRQAALDLAKNWNISPSSVSAYTNGATSTKSYDSPSQSIISHINKSRQRAIKRASRTLNGALSAITQEKLDNADVSDLSGIAKDMSVIIKNLEPPTPISSSEGNMGPQFTIYAPQFRQENSFETIVVKE